MKRPKRSILQVSLLALAAAAAAQDQELPPGAKLKVLDIVF